MDARDRCNMLEQAAVDKFEEIYPGLLEEWHPAEIVITAAQSINSPDPEIKDCGVVMFVDKKEDSDFVPVFILTEISEGDCSVVGFLQVTNPDFYHMIGILDE